MEGQVLTLNLFYDIIIIESGKGKDNDKTEKAIEPDVVG